jgi:hypothetical protein
MTVYRWLDNVLSEHPFIVVYQEYHIWLVHLKELSLVVLRGFRTVDKELRRILLNGLRKLVLVCEGRKG